MPGRVRTPEFPAAGTRKVELPDLGSGGADTHAHLDLMEDPAGALVRSAQAGLDLVMSIVDLTEDPEKTLDGLDGWLESATLAADGVLVPVVRLIAGVHPHNARLWTADMALRLRELCASDPRVRGLGELGLDFHYDHSPRDDQRRMFTEQLGIAHDVGLPVVIHLREAHDEGLRILEEAGVPRAGCIIHCFTEGAETALRFIDLDPAVRISFAGPVTFAKAVQVREAAAALPLDRILAETDCPFLAPAPYRGMPNEPAFVTVTVASIAAARGEDPVSVSRACRENARAVFRV